MNKETPSKYIAIFDSGVGGLTLLHQCMEIMPYEHYLYFADSLNVPYGNKTSKEVVSLVDLSFQKMMLYPLKAIVLACNTATSVAVSILRDRYEIPIIGMEPAIKPAVLESDPRKILVLGTELTLQEKKYQSLVKKLDASEKVDALPMQQLVDFAEEFDFESPKLQRYLRKSFLTIPWNKYHTVVLGCTHFLYFKPLFHKFIPPHIHFIDGNEGTIKQLGKSINRNTFGTSSQLKCMLSGMEVSNEVIGPYLSYLNGQHLRYFSSIN